MREGQAVRSVRCARASRQSASAPIASWYICRASSYWPDMNMQLPLFTSAFALYRLCFIAWSAYFTACEAVRDDGRSREMTGGRARWEGVRACA